MKSVITVPRAAGTRPEVERVEGFFSTADDLCLYYRGRVPEGPARGTIVFVHGVGEHCGRYVEAFESFAQQGFRCFGFDQRGFGKSQGRRGHVDAFARYADDLAAFLGYVAVSTAGQPVFLLGHSMGTFVVLLYAMRQPPGLAGLLIYSCPLKVSWYMELGAWMVGGLAGIIPKVRIPTLIVAADLSDDVSVQAGFRGDPEVFGTVTIGWLHQFRKARDCILREAHRITLPVLINHGAADRIANPAGAAILLERLGSPDRSLELYEGLKHELLNQRSEARARVLQHAFAWLDRRCPWPGCDQN